MARSNVDADAIKKRRMKGSINDSFSASEMGDKPTIAKPKPASTMGMGNALSSGTKTPPIHTLPNRFARMRKRKFRTA